MPSQDSSRDYDLLDRLVEEFNDRFRRGERPSVREYCEKYPALAADLRDLLPALAQVEQAKGAADGAEGPAPTHAPPLEHLGDFHVIREIGRGGMGVVYEAEQVSLGRRVALKVLTARLLQDDRQKRRFEREAKAAAKLHHTNIVPVFGTGEQDGTPYYVMQFIQGLGLDLVIEEIARIGPGETSALPHPMSSPPGRRDVSAADVARSLMTGDFGTPASGPSLPQPGGDAVTLTSFAADARPAPALTVLSRSDPSRPAADPSALSSVSLPGQSETTGRRRRLTYWQSVARIGVQVADALDYAHKQGVLHRDIKPSNLLLDLKGTVWVTDLGLAKSDGADNLTHTGDILGTLRYMPPEAFDGRADARGDVYSLGLTLYELVALRPAFDERERNKLIKQVTTQEAEPVSRIRRGVPRDLETIIQKATEKDVGRRYQSAAALRDDLQRFIDDEPIQARRQTARERAWRWCRHHPAAASLLGLIALLLVGATVASAAAAAYFDRLARNEALSARNERNAKDQADRDRRAAEASQTRAQAALAKAEENYARARAAVNDYLTAVSDDDRLKAPGMSALRAQLLQSALGFYQEFLKERSGDEALQAELAAVYLKVGQIYADLGQAGPAGQSYAHAQRLYEALAADRPDDADAQNGLATALFKRGQTEQAIAIWEKIVRPDDARFHADLGWAYNQVAVAADKDPARRLEFLRKALAVRERLVALRPDDAEARAGLGASFNNIAVALGDGRADQRLPLYRRAAEQAEAAYRLRPNDPTIVRSVIILTRNVGLMSQELGLKDEAVAAFRRAAGALDRRARDNPDGGPYQTEMLAGYVLLVGALREAGRLDEAVRSARRARDRAAEADGDSAAFFAASCRLHLEARAVAASRQPAAPEARGEADELAAAAVGALRNFVLAGGPEKDLDQTEFAPLRDRADFRDLRSRAKVLDQAQQTQRDGRASPPEKVDACRQIVTALEGLAAPSPAARHARLRLARARQLLGEAYLADGRAEDARAAFDEALTVRRKLAEEAPRSEQARADLAVSQTAAGDLLAAAGRLGDATKEWDEALATLEDALKANQRSVPYQTALAERLTHVAYREGQAGLLDRALRHYTRAFEVELPTRVEVFYFTAVLMAREGDADGLKRLARNVWTLKPSSEVEKEHFLRLLALLPNEMTERRAEVLRMADAIRRPEARAAERWIRGMVRLRIGDPSGAIDQLTGPQELANIWPTLALAQHQAGQAEAARASLRETDLEADRQLRAVLAMDRPQPPLTYFDTWHHFRLLQREAHRAIHGTMPPDAPYQRLHRGRVLLALDKPGEAEAEFAAAVALRPEDAEVWLTRARVFARHGIKDRAASDLAHARTLQSDDPRLWVETGRVLAELGEQAQADAAYARAYAVGKGELNRFLEAGWWVTGPYPQPLEQPCPPEAAGDPSRTVAAVGQNRDLKWHAVPTWPDSNNVELHRLPGISPKAAYYALAHVYADRDRTAVLGFRPKEDGRVWVNGRLVLDGVAAWGHPAGTQLRVPVALKAGRNDILLKIRHTEGHPWCEVTLDDTPHQKASDLAAMGLWSEAATRYAEADQRHPLPAWASAQHLRCLLATGRDEEYRRKFEEFVRRHDRPGSDDVVTELAITCYLPPVRSPDRDRWARVLEREVARDPNTTWRHYWLACAYYRGARFAEAEEHVRKAIQGNNEILFQPLYASVCHALGRPDEAREILRRVEERYATAVSDFTGDRPPPDRGDIYASPGNQLQFLITLREARQRITGTDPGPHPAVREIEAAARERVASRNQAGDDFARLPMQFPDQPRLWIDSGRRLGELDRSNEAAAALAKAAELAPKSAQVWKERGRAYTILGKWDEAAADFSRALELAPAAAKGDWRYPWVHARTPVEDLAVRQNEVFDRLVGLRPKDPALWARRAMHFARQGRWAEAEAAVSRYEEHNPGHHLAKNLRAGLLLEMGRVDDCRAVAANMLVRFGKTTNHSIAEKTAFPSLILPTGPSDPSGVKAMLDRSVLPEPVLPAQRYTRHLSAIAQGLLALRTGDADGALKYLTLYQRGEMEPQREALAAAAASLTYQRLGRTQEARASLAHARSILDRMQPHPDQGRAEYDELNLPEWLRARALVREAGQVIPAAPDAVAATPAADDAARRDRRARADRATTAFALALLRSDVGQKAEAEAELRQVIAERAKLAAEEPANAGYQSDLIAARLQLGRLLVGLRPAEAVTVLTEAVAAGERLVADQAKHPRLRLDLAACQAALGEAAWKGNRPADAVRAGQATLDLLAVALKDAPMDAGLKARVADAEYQLAGRYADLGLFGEAAAVVRPGDWPESTDPWRQIRSGQLQLLAGDPGPARAVAARLLKQHGTSTNAWTIAAVAVAHGMAAEPKSDPERLLGLATKAAEGTGAADGRHQVAGYWEYRAGRYEDAVRRLDGPGSRDKVWGAAVLAMAHHKLGHPDQARERLSWSARLVDDHLRAFLESGGGPGDPKWEEFLDAVCFYRQAHEVVVGRPAPSDPLERLVRGFGYYRLGEPGKAEGEFKAATEARPADPAAWLARSRAYIALGRWWPALADLARAKAVAERALATDPRDAIAAGVLADLLAPRSESVWTVLAPTAATSAGGSTLTVQPDGSVLASGANPATDTYTLTAKLPPGRLTALRVETLPDDAFPSRGPGRAPNGNFVLSELVVTVTGPGGPVQTVRFRGASADFEQVDRPVGNPYGRWTPTGAIDGDAKGKQWGWAVMPRFGEAHEAVFVFADGLDAGGADVRVDLHQEFGGQHLLGRFRLSVTTAPHGVVGPTADSGWSPHARFGLAYLDRGDAKAAADHLARATAAGPAPAAEWLVLGLARHRLGAAADAKAAWAESAKVLDPGEAGNADRRLIGRWVRTLGGPGAPGVDDLLEAVAGDAPAELTKAIADNPADAAAHVARGNWYGRRGSFRKAAADFTEAVRLGAGHFESMQLGILLAHQHDAEAYAAHCRAAADRWAGTGINSAADQVLKSCLLSDRSAADPAKLVRLAEVAVSGDPGQEHYQWFLMSSALHAYRVGRYADALAACRESRRRGGSEAMVAADLCLEAVALERAGKADEARKVLAEAGVWTEERWPAWGERVSDWDWHDWLVAHLLFREAGGLVAAKAPTAK